MAKHNFNIQDSIILLESELTGIVGERTLMTAFDTGVTYIMIPWEIAEILGYQPELSKERITMTTASGVEKVPLITLKSVEVLGKKAINVKAIVHNLPQESYIDGLLGISFLKHFKVCIDFPKGILEIE